MGILDNIRNGLGLKPREKQLNVADLNSLGGGWSLVTQGPKDKLLEVLDACGVNEYENPNPRDSVSLSRTMYRVFPFAKRAINDMASMVGNIRIEADENSGISEETIEELTQLLAELPILSEYDWEHPHELGADNLLFRLVRTLLLDGMVFHQDRYEDGVLTDYRGALLFESLNFDFVYDRPGEPYRLRYGANQFPSEDPLWELTFNQLGYDFANNYPWAWPLLSGGGFFSDVLVRILVAIKNVNTRKGAPVETVIIAPKDNSFLTDPKTMAAFKDTMEELREGYKKASKRQLLGFPSNVVTNTPADMNIVSKAFGIDGLSEVDHELLKMVLVSFASLLEIPIEFLGIVVGGSGFSPERFKILYKIWGTKIDNIRSKVQPVITKIINNYFRGIGVDARIIDRISYGFTNAEIRDENELQEVEKLKAETNKIHMDVAEGLSQVDTNLAREYLDKNIQ